MYDWQQNDTFNQKFFEGDAVRLNPEWSKYDYLKMEFGHLFPRRVESVSQEGDVVRLKVGKESLEFAPQVLTKEARHFQ